MNDTAHNAPHTSGAVEQTANDERITHRGPLQRWLISPEIGALIGAVVVWLFLWGNGETFGTAGTTLNWLDVAAPYGIMGTAVALLMIGGEFDLSSGVMTGAAAMIIGLFSRFYMGNGVHIGLAILVAFLAMPAIGLFNGVMVNRTGLPSFIITLASFYVGRGMMLVLSKRLADKVYVDQITDQRGAAGLSKWIAHEWRLTDFPWRNRLFVAGVAIGIALFVIGLLEQSFVHLRAWSPFGLGVFGVGVAGIAVGFKGLHSTDGIGANAGFGLAFAIGAVVAIVGFCRARYALRPARANDTGSSSFPASARNFLLGGNLLIALACLTPLLFSRSERRAFLTWVPSALRPVIAVLGVAAGVAIALRVLGPKYRGRRGRSIAGLAGACAYAGLLSGTLMIAGLQLATVQALRAIVLCALTGGGLAMLLVGRRSLGAEFREVKLLFSGSAALALVVLALVVRADSSATRFHTVLLVLLVGAAVSILANALVEHLFAKRTEADRSADRLGKGLQILGAILAIAGCVIRLIYTNYTKAQAAKLEAAGEPVPQNVLRQTVLWWVLVAGLGAYILTKTKWGNWTFAVGGNRDASRAVGVPAAGVKIGLFIVVSLCAALSGTLIALRYGTVQADQGTGLELEYIIGAVVGGCLMTGGYGTVIGASLGAAIVAMSTLGFQTVAGWNSDARYAFLGGVLLVAVLVNTYIRKKAGEAR